MADVKQKKFFTTMDILIMAVIAAITAVLSAFVINPIVRTLNIGSPFLSMWPGALHLLCVILAGGLIKKPGACMVTALINGLCQMLFGNASGVLCLVYGVGNGLGSEIGFLLFKYKVTIPSVMISSGLACVTAFFVDLIYWFSDYPLMFKILYEVDSFFVGAIVCGLVSWGLLKALDKAGVAKIVAGKGAKKKE